jgi:hypothetical protein
MIIMMLFETHFVSYVSLLHSRSTAQTVSEINPVSFRASLLCGC